MGESLYPKEARAAAIRAEVELINKQLRAVDPNSAHWESVDLKASEAELRSIATDGAEGDSEADQASKEIKRLQERLEELAREAQNLGLEPRAVGINLRANPRDPV